MDGEADGAMIRQAEQLQAGHGPRRPRAGGQIQTRCSVTPLSLRDDYARGRKPSEVVAEVYDRIEAGPLAPVWIATVPREVAMARARVLERRVAGRALPLYGVPFAVKDNIDVEGIPTTAGCPAFAYTPSAIATVVRNLLQAGAILIGKTNLDQFSTGLTGTRSPYGACSSVFDDRYISGGSSSGSAVAVAQDLVAFALGTDTAGSGRVPAAFNNLVGLKPTRGLLSGSGVVPACRSLDCISILARTCADAHVVWSTARGYDPGDPYSREPRPGEDAAPWLGGPVRFGVPGAHQLEFFGDEEAAQLYRGATARMEELGGRKVEIDFSIFRAASDLMYSGPWAAERVAAFSGFLETHAEEMNPIVRKIISDSSRFTAVDVFKSEHKMRELRRASQKEWDRMDVLLLPTTGTIYTQEAAEADPIQINTNLGIYTNFVNLLDLAAVAIPAGFRRNGLPFGVSLIGRAFSDEALLVLGDRFGHTRSDTAPPYHDLGSELGPCPPGCVELAVVGSHLSGQPMNRLLKERGARLLRTTRTAEEYRLFALDTSPVKPGLVRENDYRGPGIEVEVWAIPENHFGGFVATISAPLVVGNVALRNGASVKGLLCEPAAIESAREITRHGGWRGYLAYASSME